VLVSFFSLQTKLLAIEPKDQQGVFHFPDDIEIENDRKTIRNAV
jgi:hypothetical protein